MRFIIERKSLYKRIEIPPTEDAVKIRFLKSELHKEFSDEEYALGDKPTECRWVIDFSSVEGMIHWCHDLGCDIEIKINHKLNYPIIVINDVHKVIGGYYNSGHISCGHSVGIGHSTHCESTPCICESTPSICINDCTTS